MLAGKPGRACSSKDNHLITDKTYSIHMNTMLKKRKHKMKRCNTEPQVQVVNSMMWNSKEESEK